MRTPPADLHKNPRLISELLPSLQSMMITHHAVIITDGDEYHPSPAQLYFTRVHEISWLKMAVPPHLNHMVRD